jgi:sugar phosphate isomerase/epimerase
LPDERFNQRIRDMDNIRTTISRRDFLMVSTVGVGGAVLVSGFTGCAGRAAPRDAPIGVQLYSVRHELAEDLPGTFERLGQIGFQGVEYADYFGRSARELRTLMDQNGLRACGTHIHIVDMQGDALPATIEFNQELGNEFLIVRWIPEEYRTDRENFLRLTETLNEISRTLEPHGLRAGYHAHSYIFDTFEGDMLWDILAENTRPEFVMQLDTGWALEVDQDPAEIIRRHPGRLATMHVKAYEHGDPSVIIGEDRTDWAEVVRAAEEVGGIEWYILEYEEDNPLEALETSFVNFRRYLS